MQWVYPNLRGEQFTKAMTGAFWLFVMTCLVLMVAITGIKVGAISAHLAALVEQGVGPLISANIVTLIYLADQNRRAAGENQ
jgi:hypothetical protein